MSETIYIGSGKEKTFPDGGQVINASIELDGIKALFEQYGYTSKSRKKILKIKIQKRKTIGNYGETHGISVDTWKPDSSQQAGSGGQSSQNDTHGGYDAFDDDIPF